MVQTLTAIITMNNESIIIAGDFNLSLDVEDRSRSRNATLVLYLEKYMKDWSLSDIWKELNPTSNRRTFYGNTGRFT